MTYKEAISLYHFLQDWTDEIEPCLAYKLATIKLRLVEALIKYQSLEKDIEAEYPYYQTNSEQREAFVQKIKELQNSSVNLNLPTITIDEFNGIKLTILSMETLLPIIKKRQE